MVTLKQDKHIRKRLEAFAEEYRHAISHREKIETDETAEEFIQGASEFPEFRNHYKILYETWREE